jgi:hypothetical protein
VPTASRSNPANPSAAAAGYPAAVPVLMTGNNYAMSPEGNAQPMKMDMKMDVPAAGSVPVETPQHEGHAQPSEAPHPHEHHEANPPKQ